jgi:hypothetical protein
MRTGREGVCWAGKAKLNSQSARPNVRAGVKTGKAQTEFRFVPQSRGKTFMSARRIALGKRKRFSAMTLPAAGCDDVRTMASSCA